MAVVTAMQPSLPLGGLSQSPPSGLGPCHGHAERGPRPQDRPRRTGNGGSTPLGGGASGGRGFGGGARSGAAAGLGGGQMARRPAQAQAQASGTEATRIERFEKQFFKTKVCAFWEKGRCTRGAACKYAHGEQELHATPDLTNTALCRELSQTGHCTRKNCPFAHSWETLRATDKFYKTTMCSFFRYGRCRLGQLCRHAHSREELLQATQRSREAKLESGNFSPKGDKTTSVASSGTTRSGGSPWSTENIEDDFEDDLPDFHFNRLATSPADFGQWLPAHAADGANTLEQGVRSPVNPVKPGERELEQGECSQRPTKKTEEKLHGEHGKPKTWADMSEDTFEAPARADGADSELESSGDELNGVDDMWARMSSMPASFGQEAGGYSPKRAAPGPKTQARTPQTGAPAGRPAGSAHAFERNESGGSSAKYESFGIDPDEDDDDEDDLTLGPVNGPAPEITWARSTSLPATMPQQSPPMGGEGLPAGPAGPVVAPMMMMVPMMLLPSGLLIPSAGAMNAQAVGAQAVGAPQVPAQALAAPGAAMGLAEDPNSPNTCSGWARQMSAPTPCVAGGYPRQDFAKAFCAQAISGELAQRQMEASLLKSAMPESYED